MTNSTQNRRIFLRLLVEALELLIQAPPQAHTKKLLHDAVSSHYGLHFSYYT